MRLQQTIIRMGLICITGTLMSCAVTRNADDFPGMVKGFVILYEEKEAEGKSFTTNIFINKEFMRISDTRSPTDFILLDRKKQTIYNVVAEEKTIMVIEAQPVMIKSPIALDYQEVAQPSRAIPNLSGRSATHYKYTASGKHCYDTVSLGGEFLPDVSHAMKEFRTILAGEHAKSLGSMPQDMLDPCDLATNIFYPVKHLEHGFPLREWNQSGYQRFILRYDRESYVKEEVLELPGGYEKYSIQKAH